MGIYLVGAIAEGERYEALVVHRRSRRRRRSRCDGACRSSFRARRHHHRADGADRGRADRSDDDGNDVGADTGRADADGQHADRDGPDPCRDDAGYTAHTRAARARYRANDRSGRLERLIGDIDSAAGGARQHQRVDPDWQSWK